MKANKIFAIILILAIMSMPAYSFILSGNQYEIKGTVSENGLLEGNKYRLKVEIDQISGQTENSRYSLCIGLLCIPPEYFNIGVSGTLRYATGDAFGNGKIAMKIKTEYQQISVTNTTSSNGHFILKAKIPKSVALSDFILEFTAEKDISAIYICQYDHKTGYCR